VLVVMVSRVFGEKIIFSSFFPLLILLAIGQGGIFAIIHQKYELCSND
jgi:hypothetical protein